MAGKNLRINATRMELLRLQRRLLLARKGHKLLKDKLDGLIQKLLELSKEREKYAAQLGARLQPIFQRILISNALSSPAVIAKAIKSSDCRVEVETEVHNIMGVRTPRYSVKLSGNPINYSFAGTAGDLDRALLDFRDNLTAMVKLGEYDKGIRLIASEIIEIRRRVNALEYILIPELGSAVRLIRMKLAEIERSNTVALLKIKELVGAG